MTAVFGLVVEGFKDQAALEVLVKRCAPEGGAEVITRVAGDKWKLIRKFPGYLEGFRWSNRGSPVHKAFVVRDSDGKDPGELIREMQSRISGRHYPFEVKPLVIVKKLEAWLLADEIAVQKCGASKAERVPDPELLDDPKSKLWKALSGVPYTPPIARKIAEDARLDILEYRCSSFRNFRQALLDC